MGWKETGEGSFWNPCDNCKDNMCSSCLLNKYTEDIKKEKTARESAEFTIKTELYPRIEQEKRSYDAFVTTDRAAEWGGCFDCKVEELVDMFDEEFVSTLDFDKDDVYCKIAKVILEDKEKCKNE